MSFSHRIRMRLIRRVALGLAVAAVVAPSAAAMGHGSLYHQEGAGLAAAEVGPPGAVIEAPKTFAYPAGAVIEAPQTFAYPPGAVTEAPSTVDWRGIEVGPDGQLTVAKAPTTVDLPSAVRVGPGGQLTARNPVRLPIEVGPDGQLTAKPSPVTDAPVSFPVGAPIATPDVIVTPSAVPVTGTGFDWRIGVAAGLGLLVAMVLGAALLIGRRRGTLQGA